MKSLGWMLPIWVLVFVAATASTASAAGPALKGHWVLGSTGGINAPTGKLSEEIDINELLDTGQLSSLEMGMGWNVGSSVEYFLTDQVGIGLDLGFYSMKSRNDNLDLGGVDLLAKTLHFGAHGKWVIPASERVLPYLNIGFGMYNRKIEVSSSVGSADASDSKPGMNAGVGMDLMLNETVALGVGGAYHFTFGAFEDEFNGISMDNWNYITFGARLMAHFNPMK